jgi:hypothetical protein
MPPSSIDTKDDFVLECKCNRVLSCPHASICFEDIDDTQNEMAQALAAEKVERQKS